jgi:subtilase family serine protease
VLETGMLSFLPRLSCHLAVLLLGIRLLTRAVQCCQRLRLNRDRKVADAPFCNLALAVLLLGANVLSAQPGRIQGNIDRTRMLVLEGSMHPLAKAESDRGAVDPGLTLPFMNLMLAKTRAQQTALDQLLKEQQDPSSSNFHKWLTPEQFADRFGANRADIAAIKLWLESEGFRVWNVARSRTWIQFSGTAAQVARTFCAEIHYFEAGGERHYANSSNAMIPSALASIVIAVHGLNDFYPMPWTHHRAANTLTPLYTWGAGVHALAPGDLATIYDIGPLQTLGFTGAGQSVAIAGASDINVSDVALYRSTFGLPAPKIVVEVYGADPGTVSDWFDEGNIDLDVVSAIAPQATLYFVISANAWNSVISAIDNNYAPVLSMSFGTCEPAAGAAWASTIQSLAQQANTQGITLIASSGDSGAAACDADTAGSASGGLAVNLPASIPEVTGVGGTQFNQSGGTYWSSQNNSNGGSALTYIPEVAWNEGAGVESSGGGLSTAYPGKPSWQVAPGVPSDSSRDVPDVSFTASPTDDGYVIALNGALSTASDETWGGTSAAAPLFSGVAALLNQYLISTGAAASAGLGNLNPRLYTLAQTTTNVFHDITQGSNIVPCAAGSPNCGSSGTFGYSAGPGYDLVTGLGSIDVYGLFLSWSPTAPPAPSISSLSPASAASGASAFTLTVNGSNFVSGAVVKWNSASLAATFVSSSQLTAPIGASLLSNAGVMSVSVANPGGAATTPANFTVTGRTPSTSTLSPNSTPSGSGPFTVTINGSNFIAGAIVMWGATPISTAFSSSGKLTASVPASLITVPGTVNIEVANPGGSTSGAVTFTISAPEIQSLYPSSEMAAGSGFTLTVAGSSFVKGSTVYLNNTAAATSFASAGELLATVTAGLLAKAGTLNVTVVNPGGATSNTAGLTITPAIPSIATVSPRSVTHKSSAFTLTLNGADFLSGATVMWNSTRLATTVVSLNKLTVAVPASLVVLKGTAEITVVNPGGVTSTPFGFSVQ